MLPTHQFLEQLGGLARASTTAPHLERILREMLDGTVALTDSVTSSLLLLDDEHNTLRQSLLFRREVGEIEATHLSQQVLREGLAGWVTRHRTVALIPDTEKDERWLTLPDMPYKVRSALALPLLYHNHLLGVLTLAHPQPHHYTPTHRMLMGVAADQMAAALHHIQLYEAQQRLLQVQTLLYDLLRLLTERLDPTHVLTSAVGMIVRTTGWSQAGILLAPQGNPSSWIWAEEEETQSIFAEWPPAENSPGEQALATGTPCYMPEWERSCEPHPPKLVSAIAALLRRGKRVMGLLYVENPPHRGFSPEAVQVVTLLAETIALALDNARLYETTQAAERALREANDRLEQRVALRTAELQASERLSRSVLDASPAYTVVLDRTAHLLHANDALLRLAQAQGRADRVAVGQPYLSLVGLVIPTHLPDHARLVAGIQAVLMGEQAWFALEYHLDGSDGGRWLWLQATPLKLPDGGAVLSHLDITERKQAEQQVIRAERLAALGRMAAALAHEINNPLQAIRGNLDLVLDFPVEEGEQDELLQQVRQEVIRLGEGTRRVLSFARPQVQGRQHVDACEVVAETLKLIRKQLQSAEISLKSDLSPVPPVWHAPDELAQVCLNLLLNAVDALEGGGNLSVSVGAEAGEVVIRFTNDGPPIPGEAFPHLFEPFFTTKRDGTGLGLAVSRYLVEQHDGRIEVQNLPNGSGVRFTIHLPLVT